MNNKIKEIVIDSFYPQFQTRFEQGFTFNNKRTLRDFFYTGREFETYNALTPNN